MRREPTDAERRLWYALSDRRMQALKFRRQTPIGPYSVDFLCVVDLPLPRAPARDARSKSSVLGSGCSQSMQRDLKLFVVDTGPLITLAAAQSLGYLLYVDADVVIPGCSTRRPVTGLASESSKGAVRHCELSTGRRPTPLNERHCTFHHWCYVHVESKGYRPLSF